MSLLTRSVKLVLSRTRLGTALRFVPGLEDRYTSWMMARRDRTAYSGLYGSYQEALAAVPQSLLSGWDNPASADLWVDAFDTAVQLLTPDRAHL